MALAEWKAAVLADSPLGAWDFQDSSLPLVSFSTTSYPLTSSSNPDTLLRQTGPGPIPYAVRTTGSATRLSNVSPAGAAYTSFTVELWVKVNSASESGGFLLWAGARGPSIGVGNTSWADDGNQLIFQAATAAPNLPTGITLGTGWRHVVVTGESGNVFRAYLDGVQGWTHTVGTGTAQAGIHFFGHPSIANAQLPGTWIAGAAIYTTPLSAARVLAHYSAGSSGGAPGAPTSLTATAVSDSEINLTWTASTGTPTGYSVERCEGVGCSTFSVVGTPTATSFGDTGLTAETSYSYRVRASSAAGYSSYSSTATAVTEEAPAPPVVVRSVSSSVTFAGIELEDVISARGQVAADSGWPTCSVFVTAKPETGNEEDTLTVVAGAGTNVTRFEGKVRRFRPSAFPKGIEMVGTGTLAYAAEWAPDTDLFFDEEFPSGATDQALVAWALGFVPGISYVGADIQGTGITLGTEAPEAFDWKAGVSAWQYVQMLDQATLYRTYQQHDGTIRRVQMIGHPSSLETTFTLANGDILEGSTGERNTEQTRNAVIVRGHDYGDGTGPVLGMAYGSNDFQGDGATAATRHPEQFSSDLIEDGNDEDGPPLGYGGIDAQDIADAILNDVNKEFVQAQIRSWRDDEHGPGLTCLLDTLDRLAIGEKMWVQGYAWEVDDGWTTTYTLSGGGLEQPYTPSPV